MNYRIIGTDGKTYGPISAEKIREWITQGRVDQRTAVLAEGATDWTFIGLLPEFTADFPGTPPVITPPKPGTPVPLKTNSFATAGLIFGVLSCVICCCGYPFALLGVIFSLVALTQIGSSAEPQEGRWQAIAGLTLSLVSLLISLGLGLFRFALLPPHLISHLGRF